MKVYLNGKYMNEENCRISPFDRGFLFGDGVYEVLKYNGKNFIEFDSHIKRLKTGLNFLEINFTGTENLTNICRKLITLNNLTEKKALLYIQVTRGISNPRTHFFSKENIIPTIFISVSLLPSNKKELKKGVSVELEKDFRWSRCNVKTISLLPNVLARQKASEKNIAEAVWTKNGFITEGTHTNFFGVNKGIVQTAPLTNNILPGITRQAIIRLCKINKLPLKENYIKENEIKDFDEFFLTSTTMDVTPIIRINNLIVNKGKPGAVTRKIQKYYFDMINSV